MAHKVKMHKVKRRSFEDEMKAEGHGPEKKHFPEMMFDFGLLPEGKDWSDGVKYRIVLEGKQVGHRSRDGKGSVTIAVEKIGGEIAEERMSRRKHGKEEA